MTAGEWKNKLYFGDNLDILREHVASESVDLIYLDPPFNSNATYNVLFQEKSGERSAAQITAFEDTWHWGAESEYAYSEVVTKGPCRLGDLLQAMRAFLGQNDMMAYLVMMAQRMVELHRVLKPMGSIYLHCDWRLVDHLRFVLDAVFGANNYQGCIRWRRQTSSGYRGIRRYGRAHDSIFWYSKTDDYIFNTQYIPYSASYIKSHYTQIDETGRRYRPHWLGTTTQKTIDRYLESGRVVKRPDGQYEKRLYLDEQPGTPVDDIGVDILPITSQAAERLGYPTQKPEALLERITRASSNEGDLVLDPFCGCGTTIAVAERLRRRWIGIDITHLAVTLLRHRLHDTFGSQLLPYVVIGDPKDLSSARALAEEDRYQFEWWALGLVDARPAQDKRKGADRGVDGYINFFDDNTGKAKTIVVQVKSGAINRSHIATLNSDREREKAPIVILVTLEEPTRPMLEEAVTAGYYEPEHFPDYSYPRIQTLTIKQLLDSAQAQYPRMAPPATFKRAQRHKRSEEEQQRLV